MGQACGPNSTGAWGITEWFPIMIKSSLTLGCLPEMHGVSGIRPSLLPVMSLIAFCKPVSWVPLNAIGQVYVDWVMSSQDIPFLVNVVHPHPTTWKTILQGIRAELDSNLDFVPLDKWISKLESHSVRATLQDLTDIVSHNTVCIFTVLG